MLFIFLEGGKAIEFYSVRNSAGIPTILIEVFRDFPQSLEANPEIIPRSGHNRFLPNPL
jgi:hypothetical protein